MGRRPSLEPPPAKSFEKMLGFRVAGVGGIGSGAAMNKYLEEQQDEEQQKTDAEPEAAQVSDTYECVIHSSK